MLVILNVFITNTAYQRKIFRCPYFMYCIIRTVMYVINDSIEFTKHLSMVIRAGVCKSKICCSLPSLQYAINLAYQSNFSNIKIIFLFTFIVEKQKKNTPRIQMFVHSQSSNHIITFKKEFEPIHYTSILWN